MKNNKFLKWLWIGLYSIPAAFLSNKILNQFNLIEFNLILALLFILGFNLYLKNNKFRYKVLIILIPLYFDYLKGVFLNAIKHLNLNLPEVSNFKYSIPNLNINSDYILFFISLICISLMVYIPFSLEFPSVKIIKGNSLNGEDAERVVKFNGFRGLFQKGMYYQSKDHYGWLTCCKIDDFNKFEFYND